MRRKKTALRWCTRITPCGKWDFNCRNGFQTDKYLWFINWNCEYVENWKQKSMNRQSDKWTGEKMCWYKTLFSSYSVFIRRYFKYGIEMEWIRYIRWWFGRIWTLNIFESIYIIRLYDFRHHPCPSHFTDLEYNNNKLNNSHCRLTLCSLSSNFV